MSRRRIGGGGSDRKKKSSVNPRSENVNITSLPTFNINIIKYEIDDHLIEIPVLLRITHKAY